MSSFTLDAIDRQIVSLLLEDGRISSAEITRRIGHVSERAVRYRIERLLRTGVIRVSAIVNPQAVGFTVIGDVLIDVAPGQLQDVAAQLVEFPTVSYVAGSVGEGDLSVQVYARDTEELLRFVNEVIGKVPGVTRTKLAMVPWKLKDVYQWHVPCRRPLRKGGPSADRAFTVHRRRDHRIAHRRLRAQLADRWDWQGGTVAEELAFARKASGLVRGLVHDGRLRRRLHEPGAHAQHLVHDQPRVWASSWAAT